MYKKVVSKAPGRVCLFGDHQDYLGLPIIATTINNEIIIQAEKNSSNEFKIYKKDLGLTDIITLNNEFDKDERDFLKIALNVMKDYDCIPKSGYDITITSTIPINSGLSSSSALIVAWVNFLLTTFTNYEITPNLLAEIAYRIEVLEIDGSGGKMDQYTIANGKTIYLDTVTNDIRPFNHKLCDMVIGVSNQGKDTQGLLRSLKESASKSIQVVNSHIKDFSLKNIKNIDLEECLKFLDESLKPYFRAAVGNYKTTIDAKNEFQKENLNIEKIGDLMNIHHNFLKNDLKITTPEIDNMIDIAREFGSLGTKIVGSGGGGSIVCLSNDRSASSKIVNELKSYGVKDAFIANQGKGPTIYYE
tara:strand:+ start:486 stop:1565 length:1080 start_codon:yes stop_codon:yes gene_type:complete